MFRTCFCLITLLLAVATAANLSYLRRHQTQTPTPTSTPTQSQAYYYNAPSASASTMAQLRRIVLGHLQRFQLADRQYATLYQGQQQQQQPEMQQLSSYRQAVMAAASQRSMEYAIAPNTPTPKNYAMNFLPDGKDVAPGTSYIPLRLLLIRR